MNSSKINITYKFVTLTAHPRFGTYEPYHLAIAIEASEKEIQSSYFEKKGPRNKRPQFSSSIAAQKRRVARARAHSLADVSRQVKERSAGTYNSLFSGVCFFSFTFCFVYPGCGWLSRIGLIDCSAEGSFDALEG